MIRPTWWKFIMAVVSGLVLLIPACGSGGSPASSTSAAVPSSSAAASPATSPPNAALCADAAALRASLAKLTHVQVRPGTVNEIKADLQNVRAALTTFVDDARGQWQAQTSALNSSLAKLQAAVKTLTASPSTSAVSGVAAALGEVNTAAQDLLAAVSTRCPSASPAPGG